MNDIWRGVLLQCELLYYGGEACMCLSVFQSVAMQETKTSKTWVMRGEQKIMVVRYVRE